MHPARSIIFFTTMSGAGFGMLGIAAFLLAMGWGDITSLLISAVIAMVLSSAGLFSSLLHLGNPQRAWRALSQWQSSWLSREGVLAIATMGMAVLWLGGWALTGVFVIELGFIVSILSAITVYATAMIYAQLRPVPRWHTVLTPLCYLGFALSSGVLGVLAVAADPSLLQLGLPALIAAWCVKTLWWLRADKTGRGQGGSSLKTATGLNEFQQVKLFEKPHMTANYLMTEMVFSVGRKHARRLRQIAVLMGGILPILLLWAGLVLPASLTVFCVLAAGTHLIGLFVERWLFFAEAEHVVGFYYGKS